MTEAIDYAIQDLERYYGVDHALEFPRTIESLSFLRVLYVGCGRGEVLLSNPGWVGVDFNPKLVPLWEKLNVPAEVGDARSMPQFLDNSFDVVLTVDFFEHVAVADLDTVMVEFLRIASLGIHVIDSVAQSGFRGLDSKNLHPSGSLGADGWFKAFGGNTVITKSEDDRHFIVCVDRLSPEEVIVANNRRN